MLDGFNQRYVDVHFFQYFHGFPKLLLFLSFLILCGSYGGISCTNLGVLLTFGVSARCFAVEFVVPEVVRLGCLVCSFSCLSSTKGVVIGHNGFSYTSEDVNLFLGWSIYCWLGPSYSLPLLKEMTSHVPMLFAPDVDVDVWV